MPIRITSHLKRRDGITMFKPHLMLLAIPPDTQLKPCRQSIDNRNTYPVKAARHLIGIIIKLTAGMKLRHDNLSCGDPFLRMDFSWDTTSIVTN